MDSIVFIESRRGIRIESSRTTKRMFNDWFRIGNGQDVKIRKGRSDNRGMFLTKCEQNYLEEVSPDECIGLRDGWATELSRWLYLPAWIAFVWVMNRDVFEKIVLIGIDTTSNTLNETIAFHSIEFENFFDRWEISGPFGGIFFVIIVITIGHFMFHWWIFHFLNRHRRTSQSRRKPVDSLYRWMMMVVVIFLFWITDRFDRLTHVIVLEKERVTLARPHSSWTLTALGLSTRADNDQGRRGFRR